VQGSLSLVSLCFQKDQTTYYVRPGFAIGRKLDKGRGYILHNHLQFTVLVHQSHGEYRAAQERFREELVDNTGEVRRALRASAGGTRQPLNHPAL
jgi:hypothetical protein